jgi:aminopeptidase N
MYRLTADDASLPAQAEALGAVIDAMAARFGEYPYSRFSIAEAPDPVPGFWAASEQGFILAKPGVFAGEGGNVPLFAHEAAHAWWGNLVGTDGPGGIFLSESLSQYGAVIAIEEIEGAEAATRFLRFSRPEYVFNQCARGYFAVIRGGEDRPISAIEDGGGINHTIADSKGHWVHHMLRRRVGDAVYFETLKALKDRFAGANLSLDEFRRTFIAAAPAGRLERFFEQWLDRTGAPVLDFDWRRMGGDAIDVTIVQLQDGEPYELDLEIEMTGVGAPRLETITVSEREQTVRVEAPPLTTSVRLDPGHRVLRWTPEYGARPQEATPKLDTPG